MNKSHYLHRLTAVIISFAVFVSLEVTASTVFTDSTFDLANYTIDTYQSGSVTINTFQTLTSGNPDAALQTIISETVSLAASSTTQIFMNNSFIYDPGTQGAIQSIDVMRDTFIDLQYMPLESHFGTAILSQNGNYYVYTKSLPAVNGAWLSFSGCGLQASDFDFVTDPLTAATDPTRHPDFTSGVIQFGLAIHTDIQGSLAQPVSDIRADNMSYTVNTGGPAARVDLSGDIKTASGTDICAMVLASGKYMFSCNPPGVFSLADLPRESDCTVKRQIYADGFFPKVDILPGSADEAVVMTHSGTCPSYNVAYAPSVAPDSAGKRVSISGTVLLQDTQTPICAMVLANGQYMFSCDGTGNYTLNIPLDMNGQFKLQVYADGFAPTILTFDEFSPNNDVRMARAVECS
jgi:hypothetical protein